MASHYNNSLQVQSPAVCFLLRDTVRGGFICYGLENRLVFPYQLKLVKFAGLNRFRVNCEANLRSCRRSFSPEKKKLDRMQQHLLVIVQWCVESGRGHFVVGTEPFELGTVGAVYITAKQVGQLAPGYWTAPFIAAPFLIFTYAHLQISFRLDDYLVLYSLVLFCASFSLVCLFFFSSATKRLQH